MSHLDSPGIEISSRPEPALGAGISNDSDDGAGVFVMREWAARTRRSSDTAVTRPQRPHLLEVGTNVPRRPSVPEGLKAEKGSDVVISFQESFSAPEPFNKKKSILKFEAGDAIDTSFEKLREKSAARDKVSRKIRFWDVGSPPGSQRRNSLRAQERAEPHELQTLQDDKSSSSSLDRQEEHAPAAAPPHRGILGVGAGDVRLDILGRPILRGPSSDRGLAGYDLEFDDISLPRTKRQAPISTSGIPPPRRAPTLEEIEARKETEGAWNVVRAFYLFFGSGALVLLICGGACVGSGGTGGTCGSGLGGGVAMLVMGGFIAFRLFVVWRKAQRLRGSELGRGGAWQRQRPARYAAQYRDAGSDGL